MTASVPRRRRFAPCDGEVVALIRRRGLDPFPDPARMRMLVGDVVADHSERSSTSALPPIAIPDSAVRDVIDRVVLGELHMTGEPDRQLCSRQAA